MFIGSMRYIGTTGATFTNNALYAIVAWSGQSAVVIGDNGTVQLAQVGADWAIDTLYVLSMEQLI